MGEGIQQVRFVFERRCNSRCRGLEAVLSIPHGEVQHRRQIEVLERVHRELIRKVASLNHAGLGTGPRWWVDREFVQVTFSVVTRNGGITSFLRSQIRSNS